MNSVPQRRGRTSLVVMIVDGLLTVAPVFGPLGKTLHYLDDFIAERPQPMRAPDASFFVELLALIATSASNQAIQGCAIFARFAGSAYSRRDPRVTLAALAHPGQHSDAARR